MGSFSIKCDKCGSENVEIREAGHNLGAEVWVMFKCRENRCKHQAQMRVTQITPNIFNELMNKGGKI